MSRTKSVLAALEHPTIDSITTTFSEDAFIRLNNVWIEPSFFIPFKLYLHNINMTRWKIDNSGILFIFGGFTVLFKCKPEIYKDDTGITLIEFQFDLVKSSNEEFVYDIIEKIERFLAFMDSTFFYTRLSTSTEIITSNINVTEENFFGDK